MIDPCTNRLSEGFAEQLYEPTCMGPTSLRLVFCSGAPHETINSLSISDGYFNEQASNKVSYKELLNIQAISLYLNRHGTSQPFWVHDIYANPIYFFSWRTSKFYYGLKINTTTKLDIQGYGYIRVLKAFWFYNASQFDEAYERAP